MAASSKSALNIVDRPLATKKDNMVSLSAFAFLFAEIVKYSHHQEKKGKDVEKRLLGMGYNIGVRLLEYINWRDSISKRETKILKMLIFLRGKVWKALFGREASLEQAKDNNNVYLLCEPEILVSKYISATKSHPNSNFFVAGIVEGMLDAAELPAKVSAISSRGKAIIQIEFPLSLMEEDEKRT